MSIGNRTPRLPFTRVRPPHRWAASLGVSLQSLHGVGGRREVLLAACQKPGTEGADDAGSLVNTGEENFPTDAFVVVSRVKNHQNISASDSDLSNALAKDWVYQPIPDLSSSMCDTGFQVIDEKVMLSPSILKKPPSRVGSHL